MSNDAKQLSLALTAPFPAEAVHWKPLAVKGNRALAAAGFPFAFCIKCEISSFALQRLVQEGQGTAILEHGRGDAQDDPAGQGGRVVLLAIPLRHGSFLHGRAGRRKTHNHGSS
jgi:hypothetical protein